MANTTGPKCPNHLVALDRTNERGIGICPVSGYRFSYKAEEQEHDYKIIHDKFGNAIKQQTYKIVSLDGNGG